MAITSHGYSREFNNTNRFVDLTTTQDQKMGLRVGDVIYQSGKDET